MHQIKPQWIVFWCVSIIEEEKNMYPFLVENMADGEAYIQNLNIEINSKEVCYFMCGENFGWILFEIFCGYRKPKTGEILVCNKDWIDLDENSRSVLNRRLFGIAAEEFPLIEFMTIEENISMPRLLDGDKSNIEELVKAFDIGHLLQKYPSDLKHSQESASFSLFAARSQRAQLPSNFTFSLSTVGFQSIVSPSNTFR